jgi:hypothetical protein
MNPIGQRPLRRARPAPGRTGRTQKFGPSLLDKPANHRLGKRRAQSLRRWQRMDYVAHGAEADQQKAIDDRTINDRTINDRTIDEQPLGVRTAIGLSSQDFLGESRERRIALVE